MKSRLSRIVGFALLLPAVCLGLLWSTLAIHFSNLPGPWLRSGLAVAWCGGVVLAFLLLPRRKHTLGFFTLGFVIIAGWWTTIRPTTVGEFPPETRRVAWAEFDGDQVTVHEVRNFDYRSESDFDVRYDDRIYDLEKIRSLDFGISYWDGLTEIAHTFLSFGFEGDEFLAVSVEVRKRKGEDFEILPGLFKQYTLIYVWGDERDIVRLRSNHREEEVFLYRTSCTPRDARLVFVSMLEATSAVRDEPIFYNTLTQNCTSTLVQHVNRVLPKKIPWYKRRLRNGLGDRRAFDQGWIASDVSFDETRRRAHVNARARAADGDPAFSVRIRSRDAGKK